MKRTDIAWDRLDDIHRAQLIHFYPELAEDKHKKPNKKTNTLNQSKERGKLRMKNKISGNCNFIISNSASPERRR